MLNTSMAPIAILFSLLISGLVISDAQSIGVCYGRNGDNLPSAQDVVSLYKSNGIGRMRIYDPNRETLEALRGSDIEVILGVPNGEVLKSLTNASAANTWVQDNVVAYSSNVKFRYIAVGNEVKPGDADSGNVLPAMQNIQNAIASANLQGQIKVSTAIESSLVEGYPPSEGVFTGSAISYIKPIIDFLNTNGAPLLVNIYPYFTYSSNQKASSLNFALFNSPRFNGYQSLFDAMLDVMYTALEKAGAPNLEIVVSESGWPSEGGTAATVENARAFYRNLIDHVKQGSTPKRPGQPIEAYLYAIFDENQKVETVQHFGLFRPDGQPKYQLTFGDLPQCRFNLNNVNDGVNKSFGSQPLLFVEISLNR